MNISFEDLLKAAENSTSITEQQPIIIDISATASGKSYSAKMLLDFIKNVCFWKDTTRIVILTKSPRNFIHEGFEDFMLVEGRRGDVLHKETGCLKEEKNCIKFKEAQELYKKGYTAGCVCNNCSEICTFKKVRFMSKNAKGIICSPESYEVEEGDIVFLDEGTNNLPLTKNIVITKKDLINTLHYVYGCLPFLDTQKIHSLIEIINELINILQSIEKENVEGKNIYETQDLLMDTLKKANKSRLTIDFIQQVQKRLKIEIYSKLTFNQKVKKNNKNDLLKDASKEIPFNFLEELFRFFKKPENGIYIRNHNGLQEYVLNIINPIWTNIINAYKKFSITQLIILDATPDEYLIKYLKHFGFNINIVDFSIKKRKTKVNQIVDNMVSRSYFKNLEPIKGLIKKLSKSREGKIGIITFSEKVEELKEFVKQINLEERIIIGHWGHENRGTNIFSECNTLILIGRYTLSPHQVQSIQKTLKRFNNDQTELNKDFQLIPYPESNMAIYRRNDPYLRKFFIREVKQGIGRINRKGISEIQLSKQFPIVYIVTDEPMDFKVDVITKFSEILPFEEMTNEKEVQRRKDLKVPKEEGFERCEEAYQKITSDGKKPTRDRIRKIAQISNKIATEYLNYKKARR